MTGFRGEYDGKKERIIALDALKGVTIFLVVLLHSRNSASSSYLGEVEVLKEINIWLSTVRMPTFFFVSGVLVSGLIKKTWGELSEKRLMSYLWIMFVWSTCYYLIEIAGVHLHPVQPAPLRSLSELYIMPYSVLWFLYALFFLAAFARLISIFSKSVQVGLTVALIYCLHALQNTDLIPRPYEHMVSYLELRGVLFYQLGIWLSPWFKRQLVLFDQKKSVLFFAFSVAVFVATLLYILDEKGDHLQRMLLTSSFIIIFVTLCEIEIIAAFFSKLGSKSLEIFVLHQIFIGAQIQLFAPKNVMFFNEYITVLVICLISVVGAVGVTRVLELLGADWFFKKPQGISLSVVRRRRRQD